MNITVIGLGAMGGGMARSLLRTDAVSSVAGFDLNPEIVSKFYEEAKSVGKESSPEIPTELTLDRFINNVQNGKSNNTQTNVVVIVLVNESQCQSVCFGGNNDLESMLLEGSTVIVSSTVTPAWSKKAYSRFAEKGIRFLDCPISGGPVRALAGEITIMASGEPEDLEAVDPLFQAMGAEIHIVKGGAGMGSTVKMVHQLLAGVHIAVAAEALALAAKAGLDVQQMYDIVKGAAGNSWMFSDRGKRMIEYTGEPSEKVMSSLAIFIKDMDIVYSSSKTLKCPVPIATAALQQFIAGTGLGLDRKDDSQVVKVYETLSGVSVSASAAKADSKGSGNEIGDVWVLPDGTKETIVDCCDESHHHPIISNEYARVLQGKIAAGDFARTHRHAKKSLYFFLTEGGMEFENIIKGSDTVTEKLDFGELRYAAHSPENPLVHRIINKGGPDGKDMFCIDAEILRKPPVTATDPLPNDEHHVLVQSAENYRVYKLTLQPGESVPISYPFFFLSVVLKGSTIRRSTGTGPSAISWESVHKTGDAEWNCPSVGSSITNTGSTVYEQYTVEWC